MGTFPLRTDVWQGNMPKIALAKQDEACYHATASRGATGVYIPMKTELIEKASRIVGDNQLFINIVSKRVQQINHGADPYVPTTPEMGAGDIALTEIIEGKLQWHAEDGAGEASDAPNILNGVQEKA